MSSSDIAISVRGLGKSYTIVHGQQRRPTFRDLVMDRLRNPFKRAQKETFWALNDVSFDVQRGDVVGIIGRNGAGKSTLLKILSRITEPTAGEIDLYGRVGSLLEVGTGFHPELTGRENIFLNGAILGMSRAEIRRQFDAIVDFSEVEQFLDTPVKRYSSGMYVRLAFAVAAHLDPEILIVDEVLAVGDVAFQNKCLGKMREVAGCGRTVLFVSHNMNAVEEMCGKVLRLNAGRVVELSTDTRSVIQNYLGADTSESTAAEWRNPGKLFQYPEFKPTRFAVTDALGTPIATAQRNDADLWITIDGEVQNVDPALTIGYAIYARSGETLFWSYHTDAAEDQWPAIEPGRCILRSRLPARLLNEGSYRIELIGGLTHRAWFFEPGVNAPAVSLTIQGGLSDSPLWMHRRPGLLAPVMRWTSSSKSEEVESCLSS